MLVEEMEQIAAIKSKMDQHDQRIDKMVHSLQAE